MTNVFLFWSKYDANLDHDYAAWRSRTVFCNPSHTLSLQSHAKFAHTVFLFTYQPIGTRLPENVKVLNADDFFSGEQAFLALQRGHSIAHVSDLVRLRAANKAEGLVIDMDTIIVNKLPELDGYFCTVPARLTSHYAPKWQDSLPPMTVHDNTWDGKAFCNFPLKINKEMSLHITALADTIEHALLDAPLKGTKAWNFIMWTLREISAQLVNVKVFPPLKTGPIPAWLGPGKCYSLESPTRLTGKTVLFGYRLPSIQEILDETFFLQHWFESTYKAVSKQTTPALFWYNIPVDSLIGVLAERTVGPQWKNILPRLSQGNEHL